MTGLFASDGSGDRGRPRGPRHHQGATDRRPLSGSGRRGGEGAGLELARTRPVELITLDVRMSSVDGRDVFHRLRADTQLRNIPVVLVTVADSLTDDLAAEGS